MASVFVDSYTLVDSVNAQSPAATQYNSNEGTATLTSDSYTPSSAPVIEAALRLLNPGAILNVGYSQKALYEVLLMIQVNWDNAMAALDDNAGVGTTTYEANAAIGPISGDYVSAFATAAIGVELGLSQDSKVNIYPNGTSDRSLAIMCQAIATQLAVATALMDADATLGDTDYAATADIDFTTKTGALALTASATPFSIVHDTAVGVNPGSRITVNGINQEALVDFLNTTVVNLNALWVKLDADI